MNQRSGNINTSKDDVDSPSVRDSYTEDCKYLKTKGGSPAWARTTITLSNSESVTYGLFNGLKCRIGPEKPTLVHNSYTADSKRPHSSMATSRAASAGCWNRGYLASSPR